MNLLNTPVEDSLNLLIQRLFLGNRILDRMMSNLTVKFVMPKTESILHEKLAHSYPKMADYFSGHMEDRNCMAKYLVTPEDVTEYTNPMEIFNKYLEYQLELEELVCECISIAKDDGDMMTELALKEFLSGSLKKYTKQALLLVDKFDIYKDSKINWMHFDNQIEDFVIV